jgi:hypothetical protein
MQQNSFYMCVCYCNTPLYCYGANWRVVCREAYGSASYSCNAIVRERVQISYEHSRLYVELNDVQLLGSLTEEKENYFLKSVVLCCPYMFV